MAGQSVHEAVVPLPSTEKCPTGHRLHDELVPVPDSE